MKWKSPGYHFIIKSNGEVMNLQPIEKISNGVKGYNSNSIHISYIGGIDKKGNPKDTRTGEQIAAQIKLLEEMKAKFPAARVLGHKDFPGVAKACPSFDVATWLDCIGHSDWK